MLTRFTEYCSDIYNHESNGDTTILNGPYDTNDDKSPILREEVGVAVKYLKGGKSPGNDNIPAELIKNRGEAMISALTIICTKIWETGGMAHSVDQVYDHHTTQERKSPDM